MTLVNAETGEVVAHSLAECEQIIERGLTTFIEVGQALMEIRDGRLYRETHSDFDSYCQQRWGWNRAHAYRMIGAAEVVEDVSPIGDIAPPANEAQARPLTKLPTPEERREAWGDANRRAADEERPVTAQDVKEAADAVLRAIDGFDPTPPRPTPERKSNGGGRLHLIRAEKVIPRVLEQLVGVTVAVADLDVSTLDAEEAAVASSDLSKAIGVLNQLNKRLKEQATDGTQA